MNSKVSDKMVTVYFMHDNHAITAISGSKEHIIEELKKLYTESSFYGLHGKWKIGDGTMQVDHPTFSPDRKLSHEDNFSFIEDDVNEFFDKYLSMTCPHCGSIKDPWFDRTVSVQDGVEDGPHYICSDCGKEID